MKTYFLTNTSYRIVESYFLSSGNCMLLFRGFFSFWELLLKLGGTNLKKKKFSYYWKPFCLIFLPEEAVFPIVEMYFSTNASFRVMETDFLASRNHFFIYFSETRASDFFQSSGNLFLNEFFVPAIGEGCSLYWKPFTLLENFFY